MEHAGQTPPPPPTIPRTWRTLLTGRWHRSSYVVAVLVLLFLAFCNLPGQFTYTATSFGDSETAFTEWYMGRQLEHGWPLTYLVRTISESPNADAPTFGRCWQVWVGIQKLSYFPLLANLAICLLLAFALGVAFEAWRRERRKLYQFHLRDAAAVVLVICVVVGCFGNAMRNRAVERAALADYPFLIEAQREKTAGITWLRRLVGDKPFELFDDLIVRLHDPPDSKVLEGWPRMASVKEVEASEPLTEKNLAVLSKFPNVEKLQLRPPWDSDLLYSPDDRLQFPKLARLHVLIVDGDGAPLPGLSQLTSLESLTILESRVDKRMIEELSRVPSLKELVLFTPEFQPEAQQQLPSLKHLQRLDLTLGTVADESLMVHVGQLQNLRQLYFSAKEFPPSAFWHLGRLVELRYLELHCFSDISAEDLRQLASLPGLRCLNVSATPVAPALIPELSHMQQLRKLYVNDHHFSPSDLTHLQGLLPNCKVVGTH